MRRIGFFLVGVAGFALVILFSGLDQVDAILQADLRFAAVAFGAGLGVTLTSTLRWGSIANALAGRKALTYPQYYASLMAGRVLGLFLSRSGSEVGLPFVALSVMGKTGPEAAAASVALDRLFDLTLLTAWLAPVLLILTGVLPAEAGAILLPLATGVAVLAMLRLHLLVNWAAQALTRVMGRMGRPSALRRFSEARIRNLRALADVAPLSSRQALSMAGLTLLRYVLNAVLLFFIAKALGLGIPLYVYLLAGVVMQLSLLVAITPGGLGIVEVGSLSALALAGVGTSEIAAFLVGQRAFQYTYFPILGGISYVALLRPNRAVRAAAEAAPQKGRFEEIP